MFKRPPEGRYVPAAAIESLGAAWQNPKGDFPVDSRGVEAARLALKGSASPEVVEKAALAAGSFLFRSESDEKSALAVLEAARAKIDAEGVEPSPGFLLLGSNFAERIGEIDLQITLLEKGLVLQSHDKVGLAQIAATHASATITRDGPDKALERLKDAVSLFDEASDDRSRAVTMGKIADILGARGETDEALRIRREEELPVYERLGDVRSRAVTMGQIADIRQRVLRPFVSALSSRLI